MSRKNIDANIDALVANVIANPKISLRQLAENVGLHYQTVFKALKKEEVQDKITKAQSQLTELIPDAINNIAVAVKTFQDVVDKTDKTIGWDATRAVMAAHGLIGGDMSVGTINIIQNNASLTSPIVEKFFSNFFGELKKLSGTTSSSNKEIDITPGEGEQP